MSHFICIGDGFINLDHVVKIDREHVVDRQLWRFTFIGVRGEVLATSMRADEMAYIDLLGTQQIIPAQPGFNTFRIVEGTYELHPAPIVAWRSSGSGWLNPILADGSCHRFGVVEWPDGQVFDGQTWFTNRADYVMYLREEAARLVGVDPSVQH
jgi:hypothetical protein